MYPPHDTIMLEPSRTITCSKTLSDYLKQLYTQCSNLRSLFKLEQPVVKNTSKFFY